MEEKEKMYWKQFEQTGKIDSYLSMKQAEDKKTGEMHDAL